MRKRQYRHKRQKHVLKKCRSQQHKKRAGCIVAPALVQQGRNLGRLRLLLLIGDDLILDLVVDTLRQNAPGHKLILRRVGTSIDNALRVSVPNTGNCFQLVSGGGVNVDLVRRRGCCSSRLRRRSLLRGEASGRVENSAAARNMFRRMRMLNGAPEEDKYSCMGRVREPKAPVNKHSLAACKLSRACL